MAGGSTNGLEVVLVDGVGRPKIITADADAYPPTLGYARQHIASAGPPFGQRPHDPRRALGECRLDLGQRHPAWRAHGQAVEVDLHADGPSARAHQPIVGGFAAQHDIA